MKKSNVVLIVAVALLTVNWKSNHATIEILRDENNGRMNVIPCIIDLKKIDRTKKEDIGLLNYSVLGLDGKKEKRMDKKGRLFLIGGDRAIVRVEEGKYRIGVYTPTEYQGEYVPDNTETWKSNYLDIEISGDRKYVLSVEPTANGSEYNGGWIIHLKK